MWWGAPVSNRRLRGIGPASLTKGGAAPVHQAGLEAGGSAIAFPAQAVMHWTPLLASAPGVPNW